MIYLQIWADAQGESHLRELRPDFEAKEDYAQGVPPVGQSSPTSAGETYFLQLSQGWTGDFHPAPARQFVVQVEGSLEVTMSDGTTLTTGPGTVWLVEDTSGKGHRTKVIGEGDAILMVVTAPAAAP